MAEVTKADLEKELHSVKTKLGKAEARVDELEAALAAASPSEPAADLRVFGPGAVPLEQR